MINVRRVMPKPPSLDLSLAASGHFSKVFATYLRDGYAQGRGLSGWYRDLTCMEAQEAGWRSMLFAVDYSGGVRAVRMNGAAKIWKRSPGVVLSLKYGLKDCFRVGSKEREEDEPISSYGQVRVVVFIRQVFLPDAPVEVVTWYVRESLCVGKIP